MSAPVGGPLLEDWHAAPRATGGLAKWEPRSEHGLGKTARAKQRMRAVPAASRMKQHGRSFLERASLKRTFPRYAALWADFVKFGRRRGVSSKTRAAIDEQGAEFLSVRFFAGDLPDVGGYLIATIRKFEPKVVRAGRGALAKTMAAAKGFRNECPAQTKQPLPWEAACLLVKHLCENGAAEMGLAVVLSFALYLRATEMLQCRVEQLIPPIRGAGKAHQSWCLILHPSEQGKRSKVGMADEAMRIEGESFKFLTPILRRWLRGRSQEEMLFKFEYAELSRAFKAAGEGAGLGALGPPTLHQLRHGGASTDAASRDRSLPEIQQHGRWADQRSVRRYAKGGRVTQQLWMLEKPVRAKCLAAARRIGEILSTTLFSSCTRTGPAQ